MLMKWYWIYICLRSEEKNLNSIKLFYRIVVALGKKMLLFIYVTVYFFGSFNKLKTFCYNRNVKPIDNLSCLKLEGVSWKQWQNKRMLLKIFIAQEITINFFLDNDVKKVAFWRIVICCGFYIAWNKWNLLHY